jgi:hypothetical protein
MRALKAWLHIAASWPEHGVPVRYMDPCGLWLRLRPCCHVAHAAGETIPWASSAWATQPGPSPSLPRCRAAPPGWPLTVGATIPVSNCIFSSPATFFVHWGPYSAMLIAMPCLARLGACAVSHRMVTHTPPRSLQAESSRIEGPFVGGCLVSSVVKCLLRHVFWTSCHLHVDMPHVFHAVCIIALCNYLSCSLRAWKGMPLPPYPNNSACMHSCVVCRGNNVDGEVWSHAFPWATAHAFPWATAHATSLLCPCPIAPSQTTPVG